MSHSRVIWSELNTHNVESSKAFFASTLGWTFDAMPMEGGGTYWIIKADEERVGGLFELSDPLFERVPDHWMTYIGVDDVDQRVVGAVEANGTVMRDPGRFPALAVSRS